MEPRLAFSDSFCLCFLNAGHVGLCHHAWVLVGPFLHSSFDTHDKTLISMSCSDIELTDLWKTSKPMWKWSLKCEFSTKTGTVITSIFFRSQFACLFVLENGSHYVAQTVLKLRIFLPQPQSAGLTGVYRFAQPLLLFVVVVLLLKVISFSF